MAQRRARRRPSGAHAHGRNRPWRDLGSRLVGGFGLGCCFARRAGRCFFAIRTWARIGPTGTRRTGRTTAAGAAGTTTATATATATGATWTTTATAAGAPRTAGATTAAGAAGTTRTTTAAGTTRTAGTTTAAGATWTTTTAGTTRTAGATWTTTTAGATRTTTTAGTTATGAATATGPSIACGALPAFFWRASGIARRTITGRRASGATIAVTAAATSATSTTLAFVVATAPTTIAAITATLLARRLWQHIEDESCLALLDRSGGGAFELHHAHLADAIETAPDNFQGLSEQRRFLLVELQFLTQLGQGLG